WAQAWIIVVGSGLLEIGSGVVFVTSISRPFTLTLTRSIVGGIAVGVLVAALDITISGGLSNNRANEELFCCCAHNQKAACPCIYSGFNSCHHFHLRILH